MWSLNGIFIWELSEIAMCGLLLNLDNYSFAALVSKTKATFVLKAGIVQVKLVTFASLF